MDNFSQKFLVKSKYIGQWQNRIIVLDLNKELLGISRPGVHIFKYFSFHSLRMQLKTNQILKICTFSGRRYQIKGPNVIGLYSSFNSSKTFKQLLNYKFENQILVPKNINYIDFINNLPTTQKKQSIPQSLNYENNKQIIYKRQKSYIIQKDWALNKEEGGLVLISQEKKKNQGKILKFVLKKFVSTGSFMGISFPVFAMKPQTILQTFCKSMGAAPLLFKNIPNCPIERMKRFIAFIYTFSLLASDMDKPFNPTIGQTYQANIGEGNYSAQQTSHHPPQSSIYFQGEGYAIYATLQLVAHIGINSATGAIQGDVTIQFKDGGKIVGKLLNGQMSGFIIGQNKFKPLGSSYAYDPKNKIACIYQIVKKDIYKGYIGLLKNNSSTKFLKILSSKQRFTNFSSFSKNQYEEIYSEMEACWTRYVSFDKKMYIDFHDPQQLPFSPQYEQIQFLESDSRYRNDIKLRQMRKFEQSQNQKQRIEQQQRYYKKLRQKNGRRHEHQH